MPEPSETVDRRGLLKKLLVHWHLSVPERKALGTVTGQEAVELVKSLLLDDGAFPLHKDTRAIYEGATLTRTASGAEITWQRPYPWDPFTVAESRTESFSDIDAAMHRFVESEWKGGIDGIALN